MCDICSKFTIKIPKRSHGRHSSVFIVNFSGVSIADLEQVNAGWEGYNQKPKVIPIVMGK